MGKERGVSRKKALHFKISRGRRKTKITMEKMLRVIRSNSSLKKSKERERGKNI